MKEIKDTIRLAYNEKEASEYILKEFTATLEEKRKQFRQRCDDVIGLYKQRCKILENEIAELNRKIIQLGKEMKRKKK